MIHKFNQSIFRAYDIRGIVAETLSVDDSYYIGQNFAKQIRSKKNNGISKRAAVSIPLLTPRATNHIVNKANKRK